MIDEEMIENIMTQQGIQSHVHTLEEQIDALTKVCKTQADMLQSLMGTTPANLDNSTGKLEVRLSEEDSDMANPKIKRRVTIDGRQVWITANNEQEYAEKLFQMAAPQAAPAQAPHDKHNFAQYAQTWFNVFSRPNVETATATTYERQLKRYLIPAFGEMDVENIKPADVQAMFNGIQGAKETKLKAKMVLNMIFQQAIEDEIIVKNPLASKSIRITGRAPKPTEPYTVEQMQTIVSRLNQVKRADDRAFIALMVLHPLRLEEALGLKHEDIDRKLNLIHVRRSVTHPTRNQPEVKATKTEASRRDIDLAEGIRGCLPEGRAGDFIFGGGEGYLRHCEIRSRNIHKEINGYVCAPNTPEGVNYGFIFDDCDFSSEEDMKDSVYLARPWRDDAKCFIIDSKIGDHIKAEGYHNWNKPWAEEKSQFKEYNNKGKDPSARVDWMKQVSEKDLKYIDSLREEKR